MITIHKYPIDILKRSQSIKIPSGGKILSLHTQFVIDTFIPVMWVMVEDKNPIEVRQFEWFWTGEAIESPVRKKIHYVSTFQIEDLVYHLFEVKPA